MAAAGEHAEVILEATCGWYWASDVLAEIGANVHLAHPLGLNWDNRRVKNDVKDANALLDMRRLGAVPEAWIAPPPVRELREVVRYRAKLVTLRSGLKSQIQGVLTKEGFLVSRAQLWGPKGRAILDELPPSGSYRKKISSLLRLIDTYSTEIKALHEEIEGWLADDLGYAAIQSTAFGVHEASDSPKPARMAGGARADRCRVVGPALAEGPLQSCGPVVSGTGMRADPGAEAKTWPPTRLQDSPFTV